MMSLFPALSRAIGRPGGVLVLVLALVLGGCAAGSSAPRAEERAAPVLANLVVDPAAEAPDPAMVELLAPYAKEVAVLRAPIGRAAVEMTRNSPALGCWMADVVREAAAEALGEPVHAAFVNRGGIRSDLPAGEISEYTLMTIMPFDNQIFVLELDGEGLKALAVALAGRKGYFPVSGMRLVVGEDGSLRELAVGGKPVRDDGTIYRVATSSYLTGGGDGLTVMKELPPPRETQTLIREAMIEAVKRLAAGGGGVQAPPDTERYVFPDAPKPQEAKP